MWVWGGNERKELRINLTFLIWHMEQMVTALETWIHARKQVGEAGGHFSLR
jgi:hypothetical protein